MPRLRKATLYLLIALGVIVAAASGWVAGFIKPEHLPGDWGAWVQAHPWLALGILLALAALIAVVVQRLGEEKKPDAGKHKAVPFTSGDRKTLLGLLQARYQKRLDDSLEHEVRLRLDLTETPTALALDPNLRLVGTQEDRAVPRGTAIHQLFDEAGGRLLLLGAPGAGKTTLLLQLAQALVARAKADADEPVPVVVNLSSWAKHGGTLRTWLVQALQDEASVSQGLAETLAAGNDLLLLLDGLDEVEAAKREACLAAINTYLGERAGRAAVCSRTQEYAQLRQKLALERAVRLEPLEPEQVLRSLKGIAGTGGLQTMLREDDRLCALVTTPLMLSVMLLTYEGKQAYTIRAATAAEREQALWDDYVTRMIARRPTKYAAKDTLTWLAWLAGRLRQDDRAEFIPDRIQPAWLTNHAAYNWTVRLVFGLVFGLVGGLVFGLVFGLVIGLVFGLVFGLVENTASIDLEEKVSWSWRQFAVNWKGDLKEGLAVVLVLGLVFGLVSGLGLVFGLVFGLVVGLVFGLVNAGRSVTTVDRSQMPGDRVHTSRRNGLVFGLVIGLGSLVFGLVFGLVSPLVLGLVSPLVLGLVVGLGNWGGGEALKHDILRWRLAREGAMPWKMFDFLRTASDLLLLQQIGGTVRFRHLLLRDYFAGLTPARIEALAARIDRREPEVEAALPTPATV